MVTRARRVIVTGVMTAVVSTAVAMIVSMVVVGTAGIRDEQTQGRIFAACFAAACLAATAARRRRTSSRPVG